MGLQFVQQFALHIEGGVGVLWCDNLVAVRALNAGRSRNKILASIARDFKLQCLRFGVQIHVVYIPTLRNLEADAISRLQLGTRIADWSFRPQQMAYWRRLCGGEFDLDMFASPSGHNRQATSFRSITSPGLVSFQGHERVWAFPPPSLAAETLGRALEWAVELVLLVVPEAMFTISPHQPSWRLLHVYTVEQLSEHRHFQRSVNGSFVDCHSPGYSIAVLVRVRDYDGIRHRL